MDNFSGVIKQKLQAFSIEAKYESIKSEYILQITLQIMIGFFPY